MIGTSSGKWNRGSPLVPVMPFVSGVKSLREARWCEISGEGEGESDWETRCDAQWKFWSLIGHLICWSHLWDWASDYRRDYLVRVRLSFFVFCLSPALPAYLFQCHSLFCLQLSLPGLHFAPLSSSEATAFSLLYIHRHTQYLTTRLDKEFQAFVTYQTAKVS